MNLTPLHRPAWRQAWARRICGTALAMAVLLPMAASAQVLAQAEATAAGGGPIRLRQPMQTNDNAQQRPASRLTETALPQPAPAGQPVLPSDFEAYVRKQTGNATLRRFGVGLIDGLLPSEDVADYNPLVPPDYLLRVGDELLLTLWGSVDADLRLRVDSTGRISIPRVGPVMASGVRLSELPEVIRHRVALVFRNFELSVTLAQLRGQRVYVTGFVQKPGAQTVNGLATLAQALMRAGGPSPAGSFRDIQLRRSGKTLARFDLYDLLLQGDRSSDLVLQADDVIHVGPVGAQVALVGSVNQAAIFEIKPNETVEDVLKMAGGFSPVADKRHLALERLDIALSGRVSQLTLPEASRLPLANGDLLRAFNAADVALPGGQLSKRVRVEGEVARPGEYVLPAASTLSDALRAAGGTTAGAFLYATEFNRESVRISQQTNYERALRDFETQLTTAVSTRRTSTPEEVAAASSNNAANARLIEQLRTLKPTGRIVLQLTPSSQSLPDLVLEDGDRLNIPSRPTTVGVFGSVFSSGSFLHAPGRTVDDYLRFAGGPTKGADQSSIFVIRANGTVSSSLQETSFFRRGNQIAELVADPGDTVFVPDEMSKVTWIQNAKDWTQILYQFGIGLAGIKSAVN